MIETENTLRRNDCGRWEFDDIELTSGCAVEIQIDGQWLCGVIEYWHDNYYWFSRKDGVPVVLHSGIKARIHNTQQRSNSNK